MSVTRHTEKRKLRHKIMTSTKLENLLKKGSAGSLGKIIQTAQNMDLLTTALKKALDAEIAPELVAANLREDGELVIICASPAWASRLRFETDKLLDAALRAGFDANSIKVTVGHG